MTAHLERLLIAVTFPLHEYTQLFAMGLFVKHLSPAYPSPLRHDGRSGAFTRTSQGKC
jgi:hypothetical protein